jgi:hypothetical protein
MDIFNDDNDIGTNKKKEKAYTVANNIEEKIKNKANAISHDFGICNKCESFFYIEYELGDYKAVCIFSHENIFPINHTKKIVKCSCFYDKSNTSIRDMVNMAWDIKTKESMGFK